MLHMLLWLYTHVSSTCFKCFICFRRMLQTFHLDVSKVDFGEEHMLQLHAAAATWVTTPPGAVCMRTDDHAVC
jgi:hypothetical protein